MAGSTPIYGFPYPESSDLVANYPALGQDLAEDIESTISGLTLGALTLVNTIALTGSSLSINNCFTSSYRNYLLVWRVGLSGASTNFFMRLRASGTDSATNYNHYLFRGSGGSTVSQNNTSQTYFQLDMVTGTGHKAGFTHVYDPQTAARNTGILSSSYSASNAGVGFQGGYHDVTASYDGFTLLTGTGDTMSNGQISIYGLSE